MRWYVISCKDREIAVNNLNSMGFTTFVPILRVRTANGERELSMFGNYIFVRFDIISDRWQRIWNTRGVRGLLCMDEGKPSPVPREVIKMLRKGDNVEDLVKAFKVGETLRVKGGPFDGHEGFCCFSSTKRVIVLLHLLGEETRVYLKPHQLEHVE